MKDQKTETQKKEGSSIKLVGSVKEVTGKGTQYQDGRKYSERQ